MALLCKSSTHYRFLVLLWSEFFDENLEELLLSMENDSCKTRRQQTFCDDMGILGEWTSLVTSKFMAHNTYQKRTHYTYVAAMK